MQTGTPRCAAAGTDGVNGQDQRRRRRDMAHDQQPRPIGHRLHDRRHRLFGRLERPRQIDGHSFGARTPARPIPDPLHGTVFVIGQQHLIAGAQPDAVGHDAHAGRRVLDKHDVFRRRVDELS